MTLLFQWNKMNSKESSSTAYTHLKNKIENNSTWKGAFYQNEWVKIDSNWVI